MVKVTLRLYRLTMAFDYTKIFFALCYYSQIQGNPDNDNADGDATSGQLFIQKVLDGENVTESPGYLLFTAPYRLCEGGCDKSVKNLVMAFPLFVGDAGKQFYRRLYSRDYIKQGTSKNAPFPTKITTRPYTSCSPEKSTITEITTETTTESITTTTTEPTTELDVSEISKSTAPIHADSPSSSSTSSQQKLAVKCPDVGKCRRTSHNNKLQPAKWPPVPGKRRTIARYHHVRVSPQRFYRSKERGRKETQHRRLDDIATGNYESIAGWAVLAVCSLAPASSSLLPWDNWSWIHSQAPKQHIFRRQDRMPIKTPIYECQCPPNDVCRVEYRINEEAIDFLKLRGVLKDEDVKQYKDDIRIINEKLQIERRMQSRRSRRDIFDAEEGAPCCCPPKTLMMPTFITDKRFNKMRDYLQKQNSEAT